MKHRCPVCYKTVNETPQERTEQAKFFPFCSERCKLIDLGAWLDGKYKIISDSQSHQPQSDDSIDTHSNNR